MTTQKALKIFDLQTVDDIDQDELKKAYRKLASQKHPDKEGGSSQEFVELREAYLFLSTKVAKVKIVKNNLEKSLQELSKDEILSKYYQDTEGLQQKIESYELATATHIQTLEKTRREADILVEKFEAKKNLLRKELDEALLLLERKVSPGLFKRLLSIFRRRLTEEEFWRLYNLEIQNFIRKDADTDVEFFKELLSLYGGALNQVAESITEI